MNMVIYSFAIVVREVVVEPCDTINDGRNFDDKF